MSAIYAANWRAQYAAFKLSYQYTLLSTIFQTVATAKYATHCPAFSAAVSASYGPTKSTANRATIKATDMQTLGATKSHSYWSAKSATNYNSYIATFKPTE